MVVAGDLKDGILRGRAYKNLGSGAYGCWNYSSYASCVLIVGFGSVLVLIGGALLPPILLLLPVIWVYAGRGILDENRTRRALRRVRGARPARAEPDCARD